MTRKRTRKAVSKIENPWVIGPTKYTSLAPVLKSVIEEDTTKFPKYVFKEVKAKNNNSYLDTLRTLSMPNTQSG